MTLETTLRTHGMTLTDAERQRIDHHLAALDRRLTHRPSPTAVLVLEEHRNRRQIEANLRVQVGPLGDHLVSHQTAETVDRAVRLAVEDVERQIERKVAGQRGEPTFGVPSRRLPTSLRPAQGPYEMAPDEHEEEEKPETGSTL
jgi:ribosome-associated translation inhibitor RaiA